MCVVVYSGVLCMRENVCTGVCMCVYVCVRESAHTRPRTHIGVCDTLQHTVTHCNSLQHTATNCIAWLPAHPRLGYRDGMPLIRHRDQPDSCKTCGELLKKFRDPNLPQTKCIRKTKYNEIPQRTHWHQHTHERGEGSQPATFAGKSRSAVVKVIASERGLNSIFWCPSTSCNARRIKNLIRHSDSQNVRTIIFECTG